MRRIPTELEAKCLAMADRIDGVPVKRAAPALPTTVVDEKDFQAAVIEEAERNAWKCYHTWNSRKSQPGFPDLVMLRGAVIIVAELKVKDRQPTAAQCNWLDAFRDAGALVFVWRPVDWPQIVDVLNGKEIATCQP